MGILGTVKAASALAKANPLGFALSILRAIWPYLLGILLLGFIIWRIYGWGYNNAVEDNAKARGELVAKLNAAQTERDAALTGNRNLAVSENAARLSLAEAVAENNRLAAGRDAALEQAEAARAAAATTFSEWRRRNAPITSQPDCQAALKALAKACPVKDF